MSRTRPRRLITVFAVLICLLLVAGGAFYLSGGYESWHDERSLNAACKGLLSKEDARAVSGGSRVYAKQDHQFDYLFSEDHAHITNCVLKDRDARSIVTVDVHWGSKTQAATRTLQSQLQQDTRTGAVPIGAGWPGSIASDGDQLFGIAELTCRNKQNESLFVASRVLYLKADDENRAGLGRFTTSTAKNAAEKLGCDAPVGKATSSVAPDPARNPVPLDKVTGTCAPVAALGEGVRRAGATSAGDAPSDPHTLAEGCYLNDARGHQLYRLTASYGSLAENVRREAREFDVTGDSGFDEKIHRGYGSAQCGDSPKRSFYTLKPIMVSLAEGLAVKNPDPQFERAALKAFAEQSAKAHGCRDLKLP
ncbi:hypothetical protein IPZ58_23765 [Streptomyces roseoverticillatus]|uniref:hypothetical protein n=1 Tax=Streptomyces roseoverticillatus TaxID=66429 RepID=UPI001F36E387|nr:hypothetical protein [Streptomyces roseoverticillatus]MCF3104585.1 hypothetical protein [Streptomyces roseoverticillatus]